MLPERLRRRVRALGDATSAFAVDGPLIDADVLAAIAGAVRDAEAAQGRVRLTAPARLMQRRVPRRYATVEPDGEDHCVVTTTGGWSPQFIVWMATLDVDVEVLGPPELATAAQATAARLTTVA